ncbi:transcriptional Coactivator p15-domain-containing protein [Scheffersomyces coipomensis]|uniref:transcriptional Coactivator p15-domain-containing protein n=1 Tax=Scheffersomyces coipomensis TaxID=1788519 RepID=UPI00315D4463
MSYNKRSFSNRNNNNASNSSSQEVTIELDKKKQVTIRKFNNINLVDIREFYIDKDSNEKRPGKKGISLTEDTWYKLLEATNKIQNALDTLNGRPAGSSTTTTAAATPAIKKAKIDEPKPKPAKAPQPEEEESDEDAD